MTTNRSNDIFDQLLPELQERLRKGIKQVQSILDKMGDRIEPDAAFPMPPAPEAPPTGKGSSMNDPANWSIPQETEPPEGWYPPEYYDKIKDLSTTDPRRLVPGQRP